MSKNSNDRKNLPLYFAVAAGLILLVLIALTQQGVRQNQLLTQTPGGEFHPSFDPFLTLLAPVTGGEVTPTPEGFVTDLTLPAETATAEITTESPPTETPVSTEQPTETLTPELTSSPTASPTATLTETATAAPTDAATATTTPGNGDTIWSVEVLVEVSNQEVSSAGGVVSAEKVIDREFEASIQDNQVQSEVKAESSSGSSTNFKVSVAGEDGLDQFRQTIFGDLEEQVNLLGGAVSLEISGDVKTGETFPLLLESNPSTGFIWNVIDYDSNLLKVVTESEFDQKYTRVGSPSVQTIRFIGLNDGSTTISLYYGRPWLAQEPTSRITVGVGADLAVETLDLSAPVDEAQSGQPLATGLEVIPPAGEPVLGFPSTFDWRSKDGQNLLTPVRNQGSCGSCWAFATVGVFESAIKIQGGGDVNLSEQYLVSCNNSGYSCGGGWWAHSYHLDRFTSPQTEAGAVLESAMPYTATNGSCSAVFSHPYKLTNWYSIAGDWATPSVDQIKTAITNYGPVAAAVCVGSGFSGYSGGVFTTDEKSACGGSVNHAILLVGWEDSTQSWILRNSWGPNWGENGYMRIRWGISNVGYAANYVVYSGGVTPTPGPSPTPTATTQPAANDTFETAATISPAGFTYSTSEEISNATQAFDDPTFACVNTKGYKSVWYKFTPQLDGSMSLNTEGSSYDTILAVWQGSRGSLTSIACNDDIAYPDNPASRIAAVPFSANQTYFIEVASYNSINSGVLQLNMTLGLNAPLSLAASDGAKTTQVDLTWGTVAGASSYQVYRAASLTGSKSLLATVTSNAYSDPTAAIADSYTYWVKACQSSACSAFSNPDTGFRAPATPILTASKGTSFELVNLSWGAVSAATSYGIYRTENSGSDPLSGSLLATIIKVGTTLPTSYKDTSAVIGQNYSYWVRACKAELCGAFNTPISGWRGIAAPTGVSAADNTSLEKVVVTWAPVPGAARYAVYRAASATAAKTLICSEITSGSSYDDTAALPGVIYTYFVKACVGENCSTFSASTTGWRSLNLTADLSASDGSFAQKVVLTWQPVTNASSYKVYRAASLIGSKTLLTTSSSTTYSDTSAAVAVIYNYWVKACLGSNCSDFSAEDTGYRTPAAPVLTASKGTQLDKVSLSWGAVSSATSYEIYRTENSSTDPLSGSQLAALVKVGTAALPTTYKDTSAAIGQTHYYWVRACNAAICGPFNTVLSGWRGIVPPTGTVATNGTITDRVTITWNPVPEADGYQVWRSTSTTGVKNQLGTGNVSDLLMEDTTGIPGTIYTYWVKACLGSNCSSFSTSDTGWLPLGSTAVMIASDGEYASQVRLSWGAVYGASTYEVYRSVTVEGIKVRIKTTASLAYDDTTAPAGTPAVYWIRACKGAVCGPFDLFESGYRGLAVPTGYSASDGTYLDRVALKWSTVSGATSYQVYRSETSNGSKELLGTVATTSFNDESTAPGLTRYYWVNPCKGESCGTTSTVNSGWRGITVPASLSLKKGINGSTAVLSWNEVSGITTYVISRASTSTGTKTVIGALPLSGMESTVTLAKTYYYFVQACVGTNCSAYSPYFKYTAPAVP